jgi:hypothetical protein
MNKILQPTGPHKASQSRRTKSHPGKQKVAVPAGHRERNKSSSDNETPSNEGDDDEKAKTKQQMEKERKARNQRRYYQK